MTTRQTRHSAAPFLQLTLQRLRQESVNRVARRLVAHERWSDDALTAILVKPVSDRCNLRCTYCYEGEDGQRFLQGRMTYRILENVIGQALEQSRSGVRFLWHGGEPLLAGRAFFEKVVALQGQLNCKGIRITNGLQTNATLLDRGWIDWLSANRFDIGISLDGPPQVHDSLRIDARGNGTHARVRKAMLALQKAGVPFGVICVVGMRHEDLGRQLFSHFRELRVPNLDLHPDYGMVPELAVHPRVYSDVVIEVFERWLEQADTRIRINVIDEFFRKYAGFGPATCYHAGTCTKIVAVEANGDVVPCTRPFDRARHTFGNVERIALAEIVLARPFQEFKRLDLLAQSRSSHCTWHSMCHNGCPQHRQRSGKPDISGASLYCRCQSGIAGGNAAIWEHMQSRADEILGRSEPAADLVESAWPARSAEATASS